MPDTTRIRDLNDAFRSTFTGGRVMLTAGVREHPNLDMILERVRAFKEFDRENDPHGEHDFGAFVQGEDRIFWKLDYYGTSLDVGSEDPSDPTKTTRVLTVMLAREY